jgi:hypothetical protein
VSPKRAASQEAERRHPHAQPRGKANTAAGSGARVWGDSAGVSGAAQGNDRRAASGGAGSPGRAVAAAGEKVYRWGHTGRRRCGEPWSKCGCRVCGAEKKWVVGEVWAARLGGRAVRLDGGWAKPAQGGSVGATLLGRDSVAGHHRGGAGPGPARGGATPADAAALPRLRGAGGGWRLRALPALSR